MRVDQLTPPRKNPGRPRAGGPPSSRRKGLAAPSSRRLRARGKKRRSAAIALGIATGLVVAFLAVVVLLARRTGPGGGAPIAVDVPPAVTPGELGALLEGAGAVRSGLATSLYFGIFGDVRRVASGPHLVDDAWSAATIRKALEREAGRPSARLVIPEGLHRWQIADRVEQARICAREAFLGATADPLRLEALEVPGPPGATPESAEGFLFPATYEIPVDTPADEVVARLVGEARTRWSRLAKENAAGLSRLERDLGWTRREIVVLASMVEKETGAAEERPLVAAVFLNRLRDPAFTPRLLQSDPTTGFGCARDRSTAPSCASYEGRVTGEMNRDRLNPYSTYVREGLPPGPIASPGEAAIAAVLAPAQGAYLYFVASGEGPASFSTTYAEHLRAIRGDAPPASPP